MPSSSRSRIDIEQTPTAPYVSHLSAIHGRVCLIPPSGETTPRPHWRLNFALTRSGDGAPTDCVGFQRIDSATTPFPPPIEYRDRQANIYIKIYRDGRVAVGTMRPLADGGSFFVFGLTRVSITQHDTMALLRSGEIVSRIPAPLQRWFRATGRDRDEAGGEFVARVFRDIRRDEDVWEMI
ncbi:hypothetical protein BDZ85DRAFT_246804 [Elsinoe ampelina]|uniref:Uncharacterized protein n=1 Tax=Elsinoe ampelina TaxID=302913 RepID=A0A6A6GLD9_9PEZI|nr:hypothetical protein BDZ85DRAFT_246804 [Elsinoe ampelina]